MPPGRDLLFAAIADDYTGGSDLAGMLADQGVRTLLCLGLPDPELAEASRGRYDALVVCLKTRSVAPEEACAVSLAALGRIQTLLPRQVQFKYCSTFDSTERGNIGPVTEALMNATGCAFSIAVPALPVNGRTQYLGYLFVNATLLSESSLRHHPLNPMTEPNLVRHLQKQTRSKVGLVPLGVVREGVESVRAACERLTQNGVSIALVDAIEDRDLEIIAEACATHRLITGGSGITGKLPAVWRRLGWWTPLEAAHQPIGGAAKGVLILSGSCSAATLEQLGDYRREAVATAVDVATLLANPVAEVDRVWLDVAARLKDGAHALAYSSASSAEREPVLADLAVRGHTADQVATAIESAFAALAKRAVEAGVRRVVVAGGETAGAVVAALGIQAADVLDTLDPGVPALRTTGDPALGLVLKSGNFGSPGFFIKAAHYLENL